MKLTLFGPITRPPRCSSSDFASPNNMKFVELLGVSTVCPGTPYVEFSGAGAAWPGMPSDVVETAALLVDVEDSVVLFSVSVVV